MASQQFVPAELDDAALSKLKSFEQTLTDAEGHHIVIIAYQPVEEEHQH